MESTVYAHEGRHAIDQRFFSTEFARWSHEQREFRAKLSEIAFSSDPKFAISNGSIFGANMAANTAHGKANLRIRQAIVKWMAAHHDEIADLDPSRPLLPQFDKLTAEQIRSLCREADPLASSRNSTK